MMISNQGRKLTVSTQTVNNIYISLLNQKLHFFRMVNSIDVDTIMLILFYVPNPTCEGSDKKGCEICRILVRPSPHIRNRLSIDPDSTYLT